MQTCGCGTMGQTQNTGNSVKVKIVSKPKTAVRNKPPQPYKPIIRTVTHGTPVNLSQTPPWAGTSSSTPPASIDSKHTQKNSPQTVQVDKQPQKKETSNSSSSFMNKAFGFTKNATNSMFKSVSDIVKNQNINSKNPSTSSNPNSYPNPNSNTISLPIPPNVVIQYAWYWLVLNQILKCIGVGSRIRSWIKSFLGFLLSLWVIYNLLLWISGQNSPPVLNGTTRHSTNVFQKMLWWGMHHHHEHNGNGHGHHHHDPHWIPLLWLLNSYNDGNGSEMSNNNNNHNYNYNNNYNNNNYNNNMQSSVVGNNGNYYSSSLHWETSSQLTATVNIPVPVHYGVNAGPVISPQNSNLTIFVGSNTPGYLHWTTHMPFLATPWCNVTKPCSIGGAEAPLLIYFRGVFPGSYSFVVISETATNAYPNLGPFATNIVETIEPGYGTVIVQKTEVGAS